MDPSVSERLVAFARHWSTAGVPADVMHETKRLILNQLKASVGAFDHKTINILHDWASFPLISFIGCNSETMC